MTLALSLLTLSAMLSLMLSLDAAWQLKRAIASVTLLMNCIGAGLIFGYFLSPWSLVLLVLAVYQAVNLLRVVENRRHELNLKTATLKTTAWLILGQIGVIEIAALNYYSNITADLWWLILGFLQLLIALIIAMSTHRSINKLNSLPKPDSIPDKDLPTLSVLIPARNETQDLEECLESLVASTYPKLEIIVLDDCSQNKRTPEIIRGFAHDGIRFINGDAPPQRWLAKNYAYQKLSEAASGDLLLFCGVDTRFSPNTLQDLVELLVAKNKKMICLMPINSQPNRWKLEELLVQPTRYAWELSLPRRLVARPAVLSTCWIIDNSLFNQAGTYKAVANTVAPESFFAKQAIKAQDSYSFLASDNNLGLYSNKSFSEQRATAIRTRYPQVHKRLEMVALVTLIELLGIVVPFLGLFISLMYGDYSLSVLYALTVVLLMYSFYAVTKQTYRHSIWRSSWLTPFAAIYDIGLLNYSMWQYEFREVIWKNRNICIPTLQVIKDLPKVN